MEIYKVLLPVSGRNIEAHVKAGIMASVELGKIENGLEIAREKINFLVAGTDDGLSRFTSTWTKRLS